MAIISVRTELQMCSKSCGFRGICYEASGTYLCRCPRGFIGDECDTLVNQLTLEPIGFGYSKMAIISVRTELQMCSKSCGFRGICYEASGTYLCRCPRGFIGDECDTLVNQLTLEPIGFGYCRMKNLLLLLPIFFSISKASNLEILTAPAGLKFPETENSILKTSEISTLNENLLGLSAKQVDGFPISTASLFSRPRALAVITVIHSSDDVISFGGKLQYPTVSDGLDTVDFDEDISMIFGSDRELIQTNFGGISGTKMAILAKNEIIDLSIIQTKQETLRMELENLYKLIGAIKKSGVRMEKNNADVFRISITGLVGIRDPKKKSEAILDIQNAINSLNQVIRDAYGGQAVVELLNFKAEDSSEDVTSSEMRYSEFENPKNPEFIENHKIQKREVSGIPGVREPTVYEQLRDAARKSYGVTEAVSSDYPAMFAMILGLVGALVVTTIYIIVAMVSIDPEKDSIIYRMTTTRMKKD
ncbi:hypothetical protein L5515_015779 [Caenorhabditis briggsae]|uniref:EGF-like domain-containing protein n=1 Tax=Caenorhabditis briggsae TaxID=6238 RepID=A0AAE9EH05_CAEBR|nr:hypothetical protein L5515_015779 [Caenorhabditis briggsae]